MNSLPFAQRDDLARRWWPTSVFGQHAGTPHAMFSPRQHHGKTVYARNHAHEKVWRHCGAKKCNICAFYNAFLFPSRLTTEFEKNDFVALIYPQAIAVTGLGR